jgi:hypothetical protein
MLKPLKIKSQNEAFDCSLDELFLGNVRITPVIACSSTDNYQMTTISNASQPPPPDAIPSITAANWVHFNRQYGIPLRPHEIPSITAANWVHFHRQYGTREALLEERRKAEERRLAEIRRCEERSFRLSVLEYALDSINYELSDHKSEIYNERSYYNIDLTGVGEKYYAAFGEVVRHMLDERGYYFTLQRFNDVLGVRVVRPITETIEDEPWPLYYIPNTNLVQRVNPYLQVESIGKKVRRKWKARSCVIA